MKVNNGDEDEMEVIGYRTDKVRQVITWTLILLTVGLLRLVFYWRPDWMIRAMCKKVALEDAEHVVLKDQYEQIFVEDIKAFSSDLNEENLPSNDNSSSRSNISVATEEPNKDMYSQKYFINKKIKYVWNQKRLQYEKLRGFEDEKYCGDFQDSRSLSENAVSKRRILYDRNCIELHVTPIIKLIFTQVLHPFYIFQLFSCLIWFSDGYYYYATAIVIISAVSIIAQIYQTRSMQRSLKETLTPVNEVSVLRTNNDDFVTILADDLVPGDIIEVPRHGCVMQCDAVLITGNCIVNESMLTGESVPQTKTPVPYNSNNNTRFSLKEHSRHVLFCGTHVIQTRYYGNQRVKAVVVRTGFATAKGELVRSILYPKPVDFKFTQDGIKFVGCLAVIALAGMIYTWVLMVQRGDDAGTVILRSIDLITIVVPPALPAAMTIGVVFAQKRLKQHRIFCINPRSINVCGAINVVCFDKTGTLTEDGLDMKSLQPAAQKLFTKTLTSASELSPGNPMLIAMASCHSLTIIEGRLTGDPLDLKMFEDTNWELEEPGEDTSKYDIIMPTVVRPKTDNMDDTVSHQSETMPYEIGILKQFVFSSKLQRMSVITRELSGNVFNLYAKGSPEMIVSLSQPDTVPDDFHAVLTSYTQQGYRVIALAWKPLYKMNFVKIQRAAREDMERNLRFIGLIIMENRLKEQTVPVIRELKSADIRVVMVTGDNLMTALSVSRDSLIIEQNDDVMLLTALPPSVDQPARLEWIKISSDTKYSKKATLKRQISTDKFLESGPIHTSNRVHFCMTGTSWTVLRKYFTDIIPKIVTWGTIFSRFSPEQKQQLVEELQNIDYYVGMCGDGANDCGALKSAHAGVSLSEAESSVASPFTSKDQHIGCVPHVIREGRAALVTSYGIFKFMACYSLTQFLSVCILYWIGANLTDQGFLYIDLALLTTLCITYCYTGAYSYLTPDVPQISLIAVAPILSIIFQLLVNLACQIVIWIVTKNQSWLEPFIPNDHGDYKYQEVTTLILQSEYQYIIMAIIFSRGSPYRASIFSNYAFMINIILCLALTLYMTIYPANWFCDLMELSMPPSVPYRLLMVGLAGINFFVCFIMENMALQRIIEQRLVNPYRERHEVKNLRYRQLDNEMRLQPLWMTSGSIQSNSSMMDVFKAGSLAQGTIVSQGTDEGYEGDDDDAVLLAKDNSNFKRTDSENLRSSFCYDNEALDIEENDNYGRSLGAIMLDETRDDRRHNESLESRRVVVTHIKPSSLTQNQTTSL